MRTVLYHLSTAQVLPIVSNVVRSAGILSAGTRLMIAGSLPHDWGDCQLRLSPLTINHPCGDVKEPDSLSG